jgi:hypothetical protein
MCVERCTCQPITRDMIDIMLPFDHHTSSTGNFGWTTSWPAHCDWMILGLFTGYHIGECGQTDNCSDGNCARGARGDGSGKFVGTPFAACHPDFLFFDFCSNTVPYTNKIDCIGFVEIRFRWQKSLRHGQFCTIKALSNNPLCPVAKARRILLQTDTCAPPLDICSRFLHP